MPTELWTKQSCENTADYIRKHLLSFVNYRSISESQKNNFQINDLKTSDTIAAYV